LFCSIYARSGRNDEASISLTIDEAERNIELDEGDQSRLQKHSLLHFNDWFCIFMYKKLKKGQVCVVNHFDI
jgi:hypothetical protein